MLLKKINYIKQKLTNYYGDLTDSSNLNRLLEKIQPTEIYNLGIVKYSRLNLMDLRQ